MKIACFGAGRIGRVHATNAARQPGIAVSHIVDPVAADALARDVGARVAIAEEVWADPDVAGVIIASSTDSHADLLLAAARAGKAAFCEKPVSLDFRLTAQVAEEVRASGIPCMMGFQRRYDRSFRLVKERIASGEAGRLEQLVMFSRDPAPPPRSYVVTSGGMFRDSSIHDVDMARHLLEEPVAAVYATAACLISPEIGEAGDVDTLMITLTTVSGRQAQITACRRGPMGYDQRLEALCAAEVLVVGNQPQSTVQVMDRHGIRSAPPENYFIERYAQAYRDEMAAFITMIRDGTPPLAGMEDGLEAQRLVEAAARSAASGRVVAPEDA